MNFLPQGDWRWHFDLVSNKLLVEMGAHTVEIVYQSRMLISLPDQPIAFSLEDVANYTVLFERLIRKFDSAEFVAQLVLHILAVEQFHKPLMPKSWFFNDVTQEAIDLNNDSKKALQVKLVSKAFNQAANYLVLELVDEFALCLLIDIEQPLNNRKSLQQFEIIKVTKDKVLFDNPTEPSWCSYQIA